MSAVPQVHLAQPHIAVGEPLALRRGLCQAHALRAARIDEVVGHDGLEPGGAAGDDVQEGGHPLRRAAVVRDDVGGGVEPTDDTAEARPHAALPGKLAEELSVVPIMDQEFAKQAPKARLHSDGPPLIVDAEVLPQWADWRVVEHSGRVLQLLQQPHASICEIVGEEHSRPVGLLPSRLPGAVEVQLLAAEETAGLVQLLPDLGLLLLQAVNLRRLLSLS
mmetsp:Transcript_21896/g.60782  ORF Transcript_21896/g.60782 Transcript_21896/m.60782 type:complete len:220 (+) Transcript_21896:1722-2381(+)